MIKSLALLTLALLLTGCSTGATTASQPSLANQSIAQKFAAFNRNGWSVTGGGIPQPMYQQPLPQNAVYAKGQSPFSNSPFTNPLWHTNFRVDPTTSGAANVVTPATGNGLLGGFTLPGTAAPNVVGQPGQASVITR